MLHPAMDPFDASLRRQLKKCYEKRDTQQLLRESSTSGERLAILHDRAYTNRYDLALAFVTLLGCYVDLWQAARQTLVGDRLDAFMDLTNPDEEAAGSSGADEEVEDK